MIELESNSKKESRIFKARLPRALVFSVVEHRPSDTWVSVAAAPELSYSVACKIFQTQGLNPCLLHWQADSSPLITREALIHS